MKLNNLILRTRYVNEYPTWGATHGPGFAICWDNWIPDQEDAEREGARVVDVLNACLARLEAYQCSGYKSDKNEKAMRSIRTAIKSLGDK